MKKPIKNKKKLVFVGVSGGVDSSVSAALLLEQGFDVVGVFIRTWTPDFIKCTWQDERRDAMRVCATLAIPFLECDAEEVYKKSVADYMIEEYKKGRTPNPDVMCNREVKFGAFWNFAKERGADFIATGHYSINYELRIKNYELRKGSDGAKDQSYFLWTLTQEDLAHTLFPIGRLQKTKVRVLAQKFGLLTASKKDSQGVCFLGQLDMKDFLSHYIPKKAGDVLNEKGEIVGRHDGALFFTLGERHGFTITKKTGSDKPYYVIAKDIKNNIIIVSYSVGGSVNSYSNVLENIRIAKSENKNLIELSNVNWISSVPKIGFKCGVQIRYHGEYFPVQIVSFDLDAKTAKLEFKNTAPLVASGQSIVFYDRNVCLGGGIVN